MSFNLGEKQIIQVYIVKANNKESGLVIVFFQLHY